MTNKVKYPIEAFALAMALYTTGAKTAIIMAAVLVVVDVVLSMLQGKLGNKVTGIAGAVVACAAVIGAGYAIDIKVEVASVISAAAVGVLLGKHYYKDEAEENIVTVIIAGVAFIALGFVREFLTNGGVFGSTGTLSFTQSGYGTMALGLIFAAIVIAVVNKIAKTNGAADAGLWTGLAAIVSCAPFTFKALGETAGQIPAMLMVAVMFYTFRNKLNFTNAEDTTKGLPLDVALLGMIYMIVTIL